MEAADKKKNKMTKKAEGAGASGELGLEKKKKKKKAQGDEPTWCFQLDEGEEPGDLDNDGRKGSKKKNKKNVVDRVRNKNEPNSAHLSDEDDMLFNFNMQPEPVAIDHRKSLVISHTLDKKAENILAHDGKSAVMLPSRAEHEMVSTDENSLKKKKKNKKRKKDQDSLGANGSTQKNKKLQYEVLIEKQQLKEVKKNEKTEVVGISQSNKRPSGLEPTFSMAVAGSIVDNAQSLELATMLAGQIARAAAIFRVDEIVVFDDYDGASASNYAQEDQSEEVGGLFMVRILNYLEVPQYLRRALIPMHMSLSSVGKLPPLDAPHHLRKHEWRPFREGVVLDKRPLTGSGSCVDVGLDKEVLVGQSLKPGMRVTIAMGQSKADGAVLQVVDREAARQAGFYWGYTVRYANCLSAVFDECPFQGKYDFCIGTSEHGEKIRSRELVIPKCKHLLVVFGGLSGLEESVELDKKLKKCCITSLFNRYLNTCPDQGSRTIRTEEAILISLQYLQAAVQQALHTP